MKPSGAALRRQLAQVHPEMPDQVELLLEARGWSWHQLERGELPLSLDEIKWFIVNTDPVIFAECNFIERAENAGGRSGVPWSLFDYQKASLRYRGDVVNKSGSGVGKTREIIALTIFRLINGQGSLLFVGNQDGTLATCWREIEWLISQNPWLGQQLPEAGKRLKPYREWTAVNGNTLFTRPTGHEGEPLRSVHVHQLILGDEAAMWHADEIWKELFRAAELGCTVRLYSVPDGLRTTKFHTYAKGAVPLERLEAAPPPPPGADPEDRPWALVHWTKPEMPFPHWSAAVEAKLVRQYGGKDTNAYRQNVLGEDGDPEEAVFPWARLKPILAYIPEYRCIQLTWDGTRGFADVFVGRLSPSYTLAAPGDDSPVTASPWVVERREEVPLSIFDAPAFVASVLSLLPPGQYVAGGDFGGTSEEPSEFLFFRVTGSQMTCILRVCLRRFSYPIQATVMRRLETCAVTPSYGWGLDATGVGSAAEQSFRTLIADPAHVSGYAWNANRPHLNPQTGEPLVEINEGKPVVRHVSHKEYATQLLEIDVAAGDLRLPLDPDFLREWPSHTSRKLPSGARAFKNKNDHTIDAARAARLRLHDVTLGNLLTPPIQFAVPPGARRDSVGILEGY